MKTFCEKIFLLLVPAALFAACSSPSVDNKNASASFPEFVRKAQAKDETFLNQYKHVTESDWSDGWKLLSAQLDTFQAETINAEKNGDHHESSLDTNVVLEWNNEKLGMIRRERYSRGPKRESFQYLLYRNDSVYANGIAEFFDETRAPFANRQCNMKNHIPCKPCGEFSYADYVTAMQSDRNYNEMVNHSSFEFQFPDSTGRIECSYISARFGQYNYTRNKNGLKVYLSSDTTILRKGSCPFVEVAENVK